MSKQLDQDYFEAINLLAKWRTVFTGWMLGTRSKEDPESEAVRYMWERLLLLRAEFSAFTILCVKKGFFTKEEFQEAMIEECALTQRDLEEKFPGFQATPLGMNIDVNQAVNTTKNWKP